MADCTARSKRVSLSERIKAAVFPFVKGAFSVRAVASETRISFKTTDQFSAFCA